MKQLMFAVVLPLSAGCGLAGAIGLHHLGQVAGSGKTVKESRDMNSFHGVLVGSAILADIKVGSGYSIELEGDDNILELITTEVKDGILNLTSEKSYSTSEQIKAHITIPADAKLDSLTSSGASQLIAPPLTTDTVRLSASGASQLTTEFKGNELEIDASGASQIHLAKIETKTLTARLTGASQLKATGSADKAKLDASGASVVNPGLKGVNVEAIASGASTIRATATGESEATASGASTVKLDGGSKVVNKNSSGVSTVEIN